MANVYIDKIDWEQRRYEIPKEIYPIFINAIYGNENTPFGEFLRNESTAKDFPTKAADFAAYHANALVVKLMEMIENRHS